MKRSPFSAVLFLFAFFALTGIAHANLIVNPSFETPGVPAGSYTSFACGSVAITGWSVVCPTGSEVAIVSGTFTQAGFSFPAQDGAQWLDLTGVGSNAGEGIQQTVTTVSGTPYILSFYVGNVNDPTGGPFGTSSSVQVRINTTVPITFTGTNLLGNPNTLTWANFSFGFTATGPSTSIGFFNLDPSTDYNNGLDNVSLNAVPVPVPEPASLSLLASALAGLGLIGRRRKSQ